MPDRLGPGVKPGDDRDDRYDSSGYGCITYFITGNMGNCIMLPVWRAIGRFLKIIR